MQPITANLFAKDPMRYGYLSRLINKTREQINCVAYFISFQGMAQGLQYLAAKYAIQIILIYNAQREQANWQQRCFFFLPRRKSYHLHIHPLPSPLRQYKLGPILAF
jgi:hypothetical protein